MTLQYNVLQYDLWSYQLPVVCSNHQAEWLGPWLLLHLNPDNLLPAQRRLGEVGNKGKAFLDRIFQQGNALLRLQVK